MGKKLECAVSLLLCLCLTVNVTITGVSAEDSSGFFEEIPVEENMDSPENITNDPGEIMANESDQMYVWSEGAGDHAIEDDENFVYESGWTELSTAEEEALLIDDEAEINELAEDTATDDGSLYPEQESELLLEASDLIESAETEENDPAAVQEMEETAFESAMLLQEVSGSYNPDKALEYARNHWNDGVGLCAEFASNCIKAGGINGVWDTWCPGLWKKLIASGLGIYYTVPTTTINGKNGPFVQLDVRKCTQGLSKGDLIFWGNASSSENRCHVVIYSGENSGNYPRFYAHNSARNNKASGYNYYNPSRTYQVSHCFIYHFNATADPRSYARNDGDDFYAYIINNQPWKHIENRNDNVQIAANGNDARDPRQIWHFQRATGSYSNCYTITNEYDGRSMDLANQGTADGTNIWMVNTNGSSAQKWYIVYDGTVNKTYLYSDVCAKVVDMQGNNSTGGTNIHLWTPHGGEAQNWSIYNIRKDGWIYKKPSRPGKPNITSVSGKNAGAATTISWSACDLLDTRLDNRWYDVRIWQGTAASGTCYHIKKGITDTSYSVTLPKGTYTVQIAAVNSKYWEWFTMGNTYTFTVGCNHVWADSSITRNATCTETGMKAQRCSACGQTRNVEIAALGHNWDGGVITTAPTASTIGVKTFTCQNCSNQRTEKIAATGKNPVGFLEMAYACENSVTVTGWAYDADDPSRSLTIGIYINGEKYTEITADQKRTDISNQYSCGEFHGFSQTIPVSGTGSIAIYAEAVNIGGFSGFNNTSTKLSKTFTLTLPGMHQVILDDGLEAACTTAGKTEKVYCTICGEIITEQEDIPPLGHSWNSGVILQAATCTGGGLARYTCTRCGETRTDIVPALGHRLDRIEAREATVETQGNIEYYTCSRCGRLFRDAEGTMEISQEDTVIPWEWDNGTVIKEANCTESGTIRYTRQDDPTDIMDITVPALGHNVDRINAFNATCTENGRIEYYVCRRCGNLYKEATCINEIALEDTIIPVLSHSYDTGTITRQSTCTSEGIRTYTCIHDANHKTTEIIPALGHSLERVEAVSPTMESTGNTEYYRCIREGCGKLFEDAEGLKEISFQETILPAGVGGELNENCSWFLTAGGELTISGNGSMQFQGFLPDWVYYADQIYSLIVEEGVTDIASNAFGHENLTEVSLPNSITRIGYGSFAGCSALKSIVLPDGLIEIDGCAFTECGLETVELPDSVEIIGESAFASCTSLTRLSIGKGVYRIADDFVNYCPNLLMFEVDKDNPWYIVDQGILYNKDKTVLVRALPSFSEESFKIPEGVTKLAPGAFDNCNDLKTILLPESIKVIDSRAFAHCSNLTSLTLPSGLEYLDWEAIIGCSGLKEMTIPRNGNLVFPWMTILGVYGLTDIYFQGTQSEWNTIQRIDSFNTDKEEDQFFLGTDVNGVNYYATVHYAIREFTDWTITKEPTCTETGIKERTALNEDGSLQTGDNAVQIAEVPALGHDVTAVSEDGLLILYYSCSRCGEKFSDEGLNPVRSAELFVPQILGSTVSTALNSSSFPDEKFLSCLVPFDLDENGSLSADEMRSITYLDCSDKGIFSLEGVKYLKNLQTLNVSGNNLTSLDLSENKVMRSLDCSRNGLSDLVLPQDSELMVLRCETNAMTNLNLESVPSLSIIQCGDNPLSAITVGNNPNLIYLDCSNSSEIGELDELDVSGCSALETLICSGNRLSYLDLSGNPSLVEVYCSGNALTNLDVHTNSSLEAVCADGNRAKVLGTDEGTFDLSLLRGFDVTKASGWVGGTVSGTILTFNSPTVYYLYDIGNGVKERFLIGSGNMSENIDSRLTAVATCGNGTKEVNGITMTSVMASGGKEVVLSVEASHVTGDTIYYEWFRYTDEYECLDYGVTPTMTVSGLESGYYFVDVYDGHGSFVRVWFCVEAEKMTGQDEGEQGIPGPNMEPACIHSWNSGAVTIPATVFREGRMTCTCMKCGDTKTEAIAKLNPTVLLNAYSVPLKTKQASGALKAFGLMEGDSVVLWKSSKPAVVRVNAATGRLKAGKKTGKAKITVMTAAGATATCVVKVQKKTVTVRKIAVTSRNITMKAGETFSLQGSFTPITAKAKLKYQASDKKVVSVTQSGSLTAKRKGKAVITVSAGGKKITVKVKVN